MNKNVIIVLLILIVPLIAYWGLTKNRTLSTLPGYASVGPEVIKFSSPMCYECKELEKTFNEVYPNYSEKINLTKIDVTNMTKNTQELIKKYQIKLVPTCIFKNSSGNVVTRTEGNMQPEILNNHLKELINE
ncbi:thioredoxin family protein [bacterium]|nr:thioredoxin family protein [bacterium]